MNENNSIKREIVSEAESFLKQVEKTPFLTKEQVEKLQGFSTQGQALRYNEGKLQWSLVDYKSIEPMVRVLEYGCRKYSKDNWKKGMPASQIIESMLRHTYKLLEGELVDPESGIEHVGHIQCNAMFLAYVLREKANEYNDLQQSQY